MSLTGAEEKAFVTIEISKERISAICMYSVCLWHGTIGRESVYVEFGVVVRELRIPLCCGFLLPLLILGLCNCRGRICLFFSISGRKQLSCVT
jgi:hypothetical protein